jgi:hypothetical protein
MMVLERLRDKLRDLGFVPMVFSFDKPETKDFIETVRLLASLSKFVIVDITNARSASLELQATMPDLMSPVCPHPPAGGATLRDVRRPSEQVRTREVMPPLFRAAARPTARVPTTPQHRLFERGPGRRARCLRRPLSGFERQPSIEVLPEVHGYSLTRVQTH